MAEDRSERETLIRQIRQCREKRAENNIGQLRATWAAVCVLILAAIACFLFLPDGNRLWGVLFLVLSAALVVWRAVHYARVEREFMRLLQRYEREERPSRAEQPSAPVRTKSEVRRIV